MSVVDRVALAAAEAAGRNLGRRAGLTALRALFVGLSDHADRKRALVGALDHAIALGDEDAFEWVLAQWSAEPSNLFGAAVQCCRRLVAERRPDAARRLADAEHTRAPTARALYLRARCTRDPATAIGDLRLALHQARQAPRDAALERAAASRLARLSLEKPKPAIDLEPLDHRSRLGVLTAMLHAKGRYGRVAALDGIVALAQSEDAEVAAAAMRLAARHADADGRLTEIEIDRIRTALACWPDPAERADALSRLEQRRAMVAGEIGEHELATRLIEGGELGAPKGQPDAEYRALDAIVALRKAKDDRADRLEALVATVDAERPRISMPLLTVAWLACADPSVSVRGVGERLAKRLSTLGGARPARGWLRLSERVGDPKLADELLAIAADVREPEALDRLAERDVRAAWDAFTQGDRAEALRRLRSARARAQR